MNKLMCRGIVILMLTGGCFCAFADQINYQVDARLVVYDTYEAGETLAEWLESEGGYFTRRHSDYIEGRLPADKVVDSEDALREFSEDLLDFSLTAQDISEEIADAKAALVSREKVLERTLSFLETADFSSTLAIEKEVLELVREIEELRGRIAALENSASFGTLRLSLRGQAIGPADKGESNFEWINSLDFYQFIDDLPRDRRFTFLPRFDGPDTGPEGFSVYRDSVLFRAVSPEGVRIRWREVTPSQGMDLDFWRKAVQKHLADSGYELREMVGGLGEGSSEGLLFRWLIPYGRTEYVYLAAIIPQGKQLEIIESAGPLEAFDHRYAAIVEWIESLAR